MTLEAYAEVADMADRLVHGQLERLRSEAPRRAKLCAADSIARAAPEISWASCYERIDARLLEERVELLLRPTGSGTAEPSQAATTALLGPDFHHRRKNLRQHEQPTAHLASCVLPPRAAALSWPWTGRIRRPPSRLSFG